MAPPMGCISHRELEIHSPVGLILCTLGQEKAWKPEHTTCRTVAEKELRQKEGRRHSRKPKTVVVPSEEPRDPQQCDPLSLTLGDSPWGLLSLTVAGQGSPSQSGQCISS